ncbi:MAG: hypothetical protein SFT94_10750 [Pseudanabaenaceae cyanobacterium bins.68]|nr:hypothetical protein [Pseudanabaenaceae cyanobacterium bins.68]
MQWLDMARERVTKGNTAIIHTALKHWLGIEDDDQPNALMSKQLDSRLTVLEQHISELGQLKQRIDYLEKQSQCLA